MSDVHKTDTVQTGNPRRKVIGILIAIIVVQSLLLALTIPAFIEIRNTASKRACRHNIMMIESAIEQAKQREKAAEAFRP